MSTKEAGIKVTLHNGAFIAGLREISEKTKTEARRMGDVLGTELNKGWHKGKEKAHESIKEMGHRLKEGLHLAAEIGGGFAMGEFIHEAVQMEEVSGRVASHLRAMGERSTELRDPLNTARQAAEEFHSTEEDMLTGYNALLEKVGDPVFSREALESVAMFSNAFRLTGQESAGVVSMLREKLGATAEQISTEFGPAILDAVNKGGIKMEDLATSGDLLGRNMLTAGLHGAEGFSKMVALINRGDDASGGFGANMAAVGQILTRMRSPQMLTTIAKQMHDLRKGEIGPAKDALTNLQTILRHAGGYEAIRKSFTARSPEMAAALENLLKPYKDAVDAAKTTTTDAKESARVGAEGFAQSLQMLAKSNLTAEDFKREADRRAEESGRKLQLAIDHMKSAFTDPRFLGAMGRLADYTPRIADGFVRVLDVFEEHPAQAAASLLALKVSSDLAGPMIGSLGKAALVAGLPLFALGTAAATLAAILAAFKIKGDSEVGSTNIERLRNLGTAANDAAYLAKHETTPEQRSAALQRIRDMRAEAEEIDTSGVVDVLAESTGGYSANNAKKQLISDLDEQIKQLTETVKEANEAHGELAEGANKAAHGVHKLREAAMPKGGAHATTRGPMRGPPLAPGAGHPAG